MTSSCTILREKRESSKLLFCVMRIAVASGSVLPSPRYIE